MRFSRPYAPMACLSTSTKLPSKVHAHHWQRHVRSGGWLCFVDVRLVIGLPRRSQDFISPSHQFIAERTGNLGPTHGGFHGLELPCADASTPFRVSCSPETTRPASRLFSRRFVGVFLCSGHRQRDRLALLFSADWFPHQLNASSRFRDCPAWFSCVDCCS